MAYVTLAQLRALPDLDDAATYSDDLFTEAITYATELIDNYCGVFFELKAFSGALLLTGPSQGSARLDGILGVRTITSAVDDEGNTVDTSAWTVDTTWGVIRGVAPFWRDTLVAGTACFTPNGVPVEIAWAARTIAAQYAKDLYSRIPERALSIANDFGTTPLAQAGGNGRPTSLPDVNAVLNRWRVNNLLVS